MTMIDMQLLKNRTNAANSATAFLFLQSFFELLWRQIVILFQVAFMKILAALAWFCWISHANTITMIQL